ncbi:hypothetical protein Taro_038806 [Colocasia esculenta]|uniref:Uncharacterized protein n=1 Tax=Colocasia esculenta TaxID=4460 RepID=A0A843WKA6_COLES|nr:hypothetical protein [Colocasia esculenta]
MGCHLLAQNTQEPSEKQEGSGRGRRKKKKEKKKGRGKWAPASVLNQRAQRREGSSRHDNNLIATALQVATIKDSSQNGQNQSHVTFRRRDKNATPTPVAIRTRRLGVPRLNAYRNQILWCDNVATKGFVATLRTGLRAREARVVVDSYCLVVGSYCSIQNCIHEFCNTRCPGFRPVSWGDWPLTRPGWVTRWCRGVGVHRDNHLCHDVRVRRFLVASWCNSSGSVCHGVDLGIESGGGVKAACQVSRSLETPVRATRGLAPVGLSEVLFRGLKAVGPSFLPPFLPLSLFPSSQAVEGSLRRSGAVERPGAREERWHVRGARRRRPTNARAPSWGGFSVLRVAVAIPVWRRRATCRLRVATGWPSCSPLPFGSGFCSEGGTLAVAFGVATGQSSRSTFWGSDDALVAFSPPCCLAAGQWPRLRSGLLTLNATGRYVAFRLFWLLFCLAVFRLLVPFRVCRRWPTAPPGFPEGVPCVPVPAGLVLVTSQLCHFCGDCPACSLFARCSALEGLSHLEVVSVSWDPHPREPVEGVLRATSVLELAAHFLTQTRQSFVSLPLSALVPEPRSGARREAVAWPGCGVACVGCFCGGSVSPFARAEAGARLVSEGRGQRVPLLAASGDGLVAVVVTMFSSRRFQVFPVALACTVVIAWPCLFRSRVPVRGGTGVCGLPTSWRVQGPECLGRCAKRCLRYVSDSVGFCGSRVCGPTSLVVVALRFPATLAGEGLVIPTGPCSRGSPPYFLQLGARRRGSSVSDGLRRRLWRRVVVSSSESERCELL